MEYIKKCVRAYTKMTSLRRETSRFVDEVTNSITNTWSDCRKVLWNSRNIMYILCLLTIVLFVSLILSWNKNFVIFITGMVMILAVFGALMVSKQSCFSIFDNILTDIVSSQLPSTSK